MVYQISKLGLESLLTSMKEKTQEDLKKSFLNTVRMLVRPDINEATFDLHEFRFKIMLGYLTLESYKEIEEEVERLWKEGERSLRSRFST